MNSLETRSMRSSTDGDELDFACDLTAHSRLLVFFQRAGFCGEGIVLSPESPNTRR